MIPIHFGTRERRLFGAYAPALEPVKGRGVVVCSPWGVEALRAHRSLKFLADTLAGVGLDVLRFDYFCTGDSEGMGENVTLAGCVGDTLVAMDELRETAGIERVDLVGLRLGALIAARAAARSARASHVVLWDPVLHGEQLLRALLGEQRSGAAVEVQGFPLSSEFQSELREASLDVLADREVLLGLSSSSRPATDWPVVSSDEPPCWEEERDFGAGAIPVALIGRIAAWL